MFPLPPGSTIGILGGGQLGRMLALAAARLGFDVAILEPEEDSPASRVARATFIGPYDDPEALAALADASDVVTYEFENVPVGAADWLIRQGKPLFPPLRALETAQDRLYEKSLFRRLGIHTPDFIPVQSRDDLAEAVRAVGLPAVLKTRRLGYDGKGQIVLREPRDADAAWATLGGVPLILESFVPFVRELSVIAVRGRDGSEAFYPLVENHHQGGILRLSLAPAPGLAPDLQATGEEYARRVLSALGYVGVLAVELFEVATPRGRELWANEMAPRVHNSGHWTIEGARTSQFENHLRAILGMPLGPANPVGSSAMVNCIGAMPPLPGASAVEGAHVHDYGKRPRPGRKVGHITLRQSDPAALKPAIEAIQTLCAHAR